MEAFLIRPGSLKLTKRETDDSNGPVPKKWNFPQINHQDQISGDSRHMCE